MPRRLTSSAIRAIASESTDQVAIVLLTLSRTDWPEPLRCATEQSDVVSNGLTYVPFPFTFTYPTDGEESQTARLEVDNVTRELVDEIRSVTGPIDVRIDIVLASDLNSVVARWDGFQIRNVTIDDTTIAADITYENTDVQRFPKGQFLPSNYPGLF